MFSRRSRLLPFLLLVLIGVLVYRPLLAWLHSLPRVEEVHPDRKPTAPAAPIAVTDGDWPWWRGPLHSGVATGGEPTLPFCAPDDVLWKIAVPGRGHASPIVCGEMVFLLTADETAESISLLAFDADDGSSKWTCPLHQGGFERLHADNTHASSTPACDGSGVYCVALTSAALHVSKVDFTGNVVWQTDAGPYTSYHGYGASPLLYENLVIVGGDNHGRGFISAIDRQSGELVWRTARQNLRSQGSPCLGSFNGHEQLLYAGQSTITSYDPLTGDKKWQFPGTAEETANTPVAADGLLFATGGYPERSVQAIKLDGSGEIVWEQNVNDYVPSLLVRGNRLLSVQDNGVARLYEATNGRECGLRRLGGDVSASPVAAGETAIVINEAGRVFFLDISDRLQLVGQTDLGTPTYASPALAKGRVFIRTTEDLLCIDASPAMKMR